MVSWTRGKFRQVSLPLLTMGYLFLLINLSRYLFSITSLQHDRLVQVQVFYTFRALREVDGWSVKGARSSRADGFSKQCESREVLVLHKLTDFVKVRRS